MTQTPTQTPPRPEHYGLDYSRWLVTESFGLAKPTLDGLTRSLHGLGWTWSCFSDTEGGGGLGLYVEVLGLAGEDPSGPTTRRCIGWAESGTLELLPVLLRATAQALKSGAGRL